jgi:hypothetical protein
VKVKLKDSIFGTDEFKSLSVIEQADFIRSHERAVEDLSPLAIEYLGTIVIRSSCLCELVTIETIHDLLDDTFSSDVVERRHRPGCLRQKYPTNQDLSDATIRKRQRRELLLAPQSMLVLEEVSASKVS